MTEKQKGATAGSPIVRDTRARENLKRRTLP